MESETPVESGDDRDLKEEFVVEQSYEAIENEASDEVEHSDGFNSDGKDDMFLVIEEMYDEDVNERLSSESSDVRNVNEQNTSDNDDLDIQNALKELHAEENIADKSSEPDDDVKQILLEICNDESGLKEKADSDEEIFEQILKADVSLDDDDKEDANSLDDVKEDAISLDDVKEDAISLDDGKEDAISLDNVKEDAISLDDEYLIEHWKTESFEDGENDSFENTKTDDGINHVKKCSIEKSDSDSNINITLLNDNQSVDSNPEIILKQNMTSLNTNICGSDNILRDKLNEVSECIKSSDDSAKNIPCDKIVQAEKLKHSLEKMDIVTSKLIINDQIDSNITCSANEAEVSVLKNINNVDTNSFSQKLSDPMCDVEMTKKQDSLAVEKLEHELTKDPIKDKLTESLKSVCFAVEDYEDFNKNENILIEQKVDSSEAEVDCSGDTECNDLNDKEIILSGQINSVKDSYNSQEENENTATKTNINKEEIISVVSNDIFNIVSDIISSSFEARKDIKDLDRSSLQSKNIEKVNNDKIIVNDCENFQANDLLNSKHLKSVTLTKSTDLSSDLCDNSEKRDICFEKKSFKNLLLMSENATKDVFKENLHNFFIDSTESISDDTAVVKNASEASSADITTSSFYKDPDEVIVSDLLNDVINKIENVFNKHLDHKNKSECFTKVTSNVLNNEYNKIEIHEHKFGMPGLFCSKTVLSTFEGCPEQIEENRSLPKELQTTESSCSTCKQELCQCSSAFEPCNITQATLVKTFDQKILNSAIENSKQDRFSSPEFSSSPIIFDNATCSADDDTMSSKIKMNCDVDYILRTLSSPAQESSNDSKIEAEPQIRKHSYDDSVQDVVEVKKIKLDLALKDNDAEVEDKDEVDIKTKEIEEIINRNNNSNLSDDQEQMEIINESSDNSYLSVDKKQVEITNESPESSELHDVDKVCTEKLNSELEPVFAELLNSGLLLEGNDSVVKKVVASMPMDVETSQDVSQAHNVVAKEHCDTNDSSESTSQSEIQETKEKVAEESKKRKLSNDDKNILDSIVKKMKDSDTEENYTQQSDKKNEGSRIQEIQYMKDFDLQKVKEENCAPDVKENVSELSTDDTKSDEPEIYLVKPKAFEEMFKCIIQSSIMIQKKDEIAELTKKVKENKERYDEYSRKLEAFRKRANELNSFQLASFSESKYDPKVPTRTVGVNVQIYRECDVQKVTTAANKAPPALVKEEKKPTTYTIPAEPFKSQTKASDVENRRPGMSVLRKELTPVPSAPQQSFPKRLPLPRIISTPTTRAQVPIQQIPKTVYQQRTITSPSRYYPPPATRPSPQLCPPSLMICNNTTKPSNQSNTNPVYVLTQGNSSSNQLIDLTDDSSANKRLSSAAPGPPRYPGGPANVNKVNLPSSTQNPNVLVPVVTTMPNFVQLVPTVTQAGSQFNNAVQLVRQPTNMQSSSVRGRTFTYFVPPNSNHFTGIRGTSINNIPVPSFVSGQGQPLQTILVRVPSGPPSNAQIPSFQKMPASNSNTTSSNLSSGLMLITRTSSHPAPLPQPPSYPKTPAYPKAPPPKPALKGSKATSGIVLSWNMNLQSTHAAISTYQLFAYQESTGPVSTSLWKKVGDVKALPLPMACTLTQFVEGHKYYFAVCAVDEYRRQGPFSDPVSIPFLSNNIAL